MKISKFTMIYLTVLFILALGCVSSPQVVDNSVMSSFKEDTFDCLSNEGASKGYSVRDYTNSKLILSKSEASTSILTLSRGIKEHTITFTKLPSSKLQVYYFTNVTVDEAVNYAVGPRSSNYRAPLQEDLTKDVEDLIASCSTVINQNPVSVSNNTNPEDHTKEMRRVVSQGLDAGYSEAKKAHMKRLSK